MTIGRDEHGGSLADRERSKFYTFGLRGSDKRRLAYGRSPEEAITILGYRLSKAEMQQIIREDCVKLSHQRDIPALWRSGGLA